MTERRWTEKRVRRAYAEWAALNAHALSVAARYEQAGGQDILRVEGLRLPSWSGTGWPGDKFELTQFDAEWQEADYPYALPIEYLWTSGWERTRRERHEEWLKSREGRLAERQERAEYERLRKKYGGDESAVE